jgi:molecular chaperone HscA
LREDGSLLTADERKEIETKVENLEKLIQENDARAIKQSSDALNRATEEFATRRMDASVRRALAGRKLSSLDA